MPSPLSTRRIRALNVMGVLFLAVAVFTWGLQYKMSLYNTSSGLTASVPHAKLLSQKERPESNVASIRLNSTQDLLPYAIFLFAWIVCSLVVAVTIRTRSLSLDKGSRQRFAALDFFSFRPPPVLLPSN